MICFVCRGGGERERGERGARGREKGGEKKGREKAITQKGTPVFPPHVNQIGTFSY